MSLPHNTDAEMAVLGSILLDPDAGFNVYSMLREEFFYSEQHRLIFKAMLDLVLDGKPVDFVTVSNKLTEAGALDIAGGTNYLMRLMQSSPSTLHIEYYAGIVRDYFKLRSLVTASNKISKMAGEANPSGVAELLESFSDMLYGIFKDDAQLVDSKTLMREYWNDFESKYNEPGSHSIPTGYYEMDAVIGGYNPGDLIVVAGRPSQGKTSLIMGSMLHLGSIGVPSVLFPYEMSRLQTSQRLVSILSGVNLGKIRTAVGLTQQELDSIGDAVRKIDSYVMYFDDNAFGDIYYITSAVRRYVNQYKIKVAFIDYLQIIPTHTDDLTNEYGRITRSLKNLARSLGITVVLLSQLNRSVETRSGGKPRLSDLRQSGRIEEDADVVFMIHRDVETAPEDAEIIVAKNRNGPIGSFNLYFNPTLTKFSGRS